MTGNLLLDSIVSLAAIGVMVLLARLFFPNPLVSITQENASERLAFDEPDFVPESWIVDQKGRAAVAHSGKGELALVSRLGADLVTRRYARAALPEAVFNEADTSLTLKTKETSVGDVTIVSGATAQWARKLSAFSGTTD